MSSQASNKIKYLMALAYLTGVTVKCAAMASGFAFNKDTHHAYADLSASELTTANGYTVGGATLANIAFTEDDTNDRCRVAWDNATWTASGAGLTTCGYTLYADSISSPTNKPVLGFIDLGGNVTIPSGQTLVASGLTMDLT